MSAAALPGAASLEIEDKDLVERVCDSNQKTPFGHGYGLNNITFNPVDGMVQRNGNAVRALVTGIPSPSRRTSEDVIL